MLTLVYLGHHLHHPDQHGGDVGGLADVGDVSTGATASACSDMAGDDLEHTVTRLDHVQQVDCCGYTGTHLQDGKNIFLHF